MATVATTRSASGTDELPGELFEQDPSDDTEAENTDQGGERPR